MVRALGERRGRLYKVGGADDDELVKGGIVASRRVQRRPRRPGAGPCLVGGTAWVFSRQEVEGRFDYLFVDEAGEVSLANAVAGGWRRTT